ncbi:MAG TPA: patatin-like phospholipase family protein [Phenylobacterium sp.]|nr:patatin-like phospholipase family protein [Phenylobacterium sp.]
MSRPGQRFRSLVAAGLALAASWVLAATPAAAAAPETHRPKIALVLSGGGAMGIAHVGVIQELEKLGIRPDLVVGTSMGSIVGGLYASGMSGADLENAVVTMDWDRIFDTSTPRGGLTFREKQLETDFPVKGSIGIVGAQLRAPDALLSDANLLLELRRLVRVRAAVPTFDSLPIPFRAVATDIETGQKVVIDRGELASAMRASMSVPGVFAPYRLDGKLLVDGGMADNVPIDVARSLGADIVIVSATQTPLATGDKVRSATQVLGQTVTLLILKNEREQLATVRPEDVLISIDIGELSAADFKRGKAFIAAGQASALKQLDGLQRVAALRAPSPAVSVDKPPPTISYVRVENDSRLSDDMLLRRIQPFVGHPLDAQAIVAAMQDIYAFGVFSRVDYRIEERDGQTGLVVQGVQRPGDTNRLRPAITLSAAAKGHSEFDVSVEYRMLELDANGSDARFVGALGTRRLFSAEYFKLLDTHQGWFVAPSLNLQSRPVVVYDSSGFRLGEYDASYGFVALAVGRQLGKVGEIRVGIERGDGKGSLSEGDLTPRNVDLDRGQVYVGGAADTLDNAYFPSRGFRGGFEWREGFKSLGDVSDFQSLKAVGLFTKGFGRHALAFQLEGGDTIQGSLPLSSLFTLGGPFGFPGYQVEELSGQSYAAARLMYRYRLINTSDSLFNLPLYAGATLVTGNTWARPGDAGWNNLRVGGNLFAGIDTVIGPVFLVVGAAERGRTAFYLFVGKPF